MEGVRPINVTVVYPSGFGASKEAVEVHPGSLWSSFRHA